jgi:trehalose 6-phosphate phosphatase
VDDFDRAEPLAGTPELLGRLAARFARVAVISGRPVSYLLRHLSGSGATHLVGLYGMERSVEGGAVDTAPGAIPWRAALAIVADDAEATAPAGVVVERKGLATTIHYRTAPEHGGWARLFSAEQSASRGLVAHPGKMSVELRPPVEIDKGTAVAEMSSGLAAVCFMGDDQGDMPAFAQLSLLRAAGAATLAVAVAADETPRDLAAAADLIVEGPAGAVAFLEMLAGR